MTNAEKLQSARELLLLAQTMIAQVNNSKLDNEKKMLKAKVWESDKEAYNVDFLLMKCRMAVEEELV